VAWATGNRGLGVEHGTVALTMLANDAINPLFYAAIESTEEAIVNALLAAETMTGRGGTVAHALDPELLRRV
jgi:D-aminopeptidase